ncbi:hypothetical protein PHO31112_03303 [Pandoraea horticolens]|uniref:Uncharacterized protein n=1 Tax=Pandoraea horticolens TaxID=2508298 RepID=A0A5E4WLM4_9BURK|nr:hypothetical protein PHO31112_03303 [Pandoraea horticolens]
MTRHLPHDLDLEITLGDHFLEVRVLGFKCLEAFDIIADHLTEALSPSVNRRFAHAMALGHFRHCVSVCLAQYPHNLFVAVPAILHGNSSSELRSHYL